MSSWFSPRVEKRASAIQGRGLFARTVIAAGEIVAVKGGVMTDAAEFAQVAVAVTPAEIQIEHHRYIAPRRAEDVEVSIVCLNYCCEPNVGVRGQITFVEMRDIGAGKELAIDYAIIDGDPAERMNCACGASRCRGVVTGSDWQLPELQRRYAGRFSSYLADKIAARSK